MSCTGVVVLRAQRRREAGDLALVRFEGRRAAAFCIPGHLAQVQRTREEGRTERRHRDLCVFDHDAELACCYDQSRTHAGVVLTREEEFDTWLRGLADQAFALAREYPAAQTRIVQEGFYKEDRVAA